jgi:RNA polymerase sigma-70 factor (ECF subfamily)
VYAYARRRSSGADADDVVAETFTVAWRRLGDVPANARPWLLAVARNCLANKLRSERRLTALRGRLAVMGEPHEVATTAQAFSDPVQAAFAALSPDAREVLSLLAWDGLTPADAAVVLGCTRAALYLRLQRARRSFIAALQAQPHERDTTDADD